MSRIDAIAQVVGYITMTAGGGLLAAALLGVVWYFTGYLGADVWKRIRRIYHLRVIGYWLDRLEKNGTHIFEKAEAAASQPPGAATPKESA